MHLVNAVTSRGTILKVQVAERPTMGTGGYHQITIYRLDNPDFPLDWAKLGEIHKDSLARILETNGTISL